VAWLGGWLVFVNGQRNKCFVAYIARQRTPAGGFSLPAKVCFASYVLPSFVSVLVPSIYPIYPFACRHTMCVCVCTISISVA